MGLELDLHVHTEASHDSTTTAASLIKRARKIGLDGFAVTDHNTGKGVEAVKWESGGEFLIIPGMEISTRTGHILAYFINETDGPDTLDPIEVIEWIHEQNGLAVLAHPFTRKSSIPLKIAKNLDGIEEKNFRYSRYKIPEKGVTRKESILGIAHEQNLTLTAGSDAHRPSDLGKCRTIIDGSTLQDARDALQRGACWTEGNKMPFLRHTLRKTKLFFKGLFASKERKEKKKRKRPRQW